MCHLPLCIFRSGFPIFSYFVFSSPYSNVATTLFPGLFSRFLIADYCIIETTSDFFLAIQRLDRGISYRPTFSQTILLC
ncbi:hypothetical protein M441DRAFT_53527 [Trichoderma asperellum CBS 433.97]|uniref:Uncharacterized protein n=1 Tax=Trichoderma asperellum (strain ATCC 204424 / CBS 433.97 / NBRC 101777) TaxID=1042311 RepID=A0A2T3ZPU6_TRIA4|nr:hypothetical protein M441DRAFT_53527 [Trichoderma asperellum CBS 433.97]PTB46825.1 hypothetical protein M441DRAFT_53527 [Trichoderma asperellum CBS 433.97]